MARLVQDMKRLHFIPSAWTPIDAHHPLLARSTPQQHQEGEEEEEEGEEESREKRKAAQPEKLDKLKEYLRSIETISISRVRPSMCMYTTRPHTMIIIIL